MIIQVSGIESHYSIKTGNRVILSAQQVLDCSANYPYNNIGCNGGEIGASFEYIKRYGLGLKKFFDILIIDIV